MSVKEETFPAGDGDRTGDVARLERTIRAASAQRTLYGGVLAQRLGLRQTDLECLFIVTLGERVTPGRLAQETGLTSGAITGVVDRIERAGYVVRRRDPDDRRRVFLDPVPARVKEIREINARAFQPWMEDLARYSRAELDLLLDFAERNYQAAVSATIALRRDAASSRSAASKASVKRAP